MLSRRLRAISSISVLFVSCAALAAPPQDDDTVALVNGIPIFRRSVRAIVQATILSQEGDKEPDPATVRRLATDALDSLIDFELLFQASQAREINVSETAVDEEMNRTIAKFGDKKAFNDAIKSQGMSEEELRRDTRKSLAVNRLLEGEVLRDVRITQDDIERFYQANKDQFQHPAQTRASHILIRSSAKASKQEKAAAKAKAEQIVQLLRDGADFAELARQHSQDPGSATLGGDLGYFAAGEMDDAFEKATAGLEKGQISSVVSSSYGFHVIKVTDRRDPGFEPLAEAQERIRASLLKSERRRRQADMVAELRKSATIQYPATL